MELYAKDIMSTTLITLRKDMTIEEAARILRVNQYRRSARH